MGLEHAFAYNKGETEPKSAITGLDKDNKPVYEPVKQYIGMRDVPQYLFDKLLDDVNKQQDRYLPMKFKKEDLLKIGINTKIIKEYYEVGEVNTRKGYYILVKILPSGMREAKKFNIMLARDLRLGANPDLVACNEEELEYWLRG